MTEHQTEFKINQKIVYPSQGLGTITAIEERAFKDEKRLYYAVAIEVSDMAVLIPVDKAGELGVRAIVGEEEARGALAYIGEAFEANPSDWKLRYQMNIDLLKKGGVNDIAGIVRSLYHRSKQKELPILERKLYDSAQRLLEDELSLALGKPKEEIEALIHERLESRSGK